MAAWKPAASAACTAVSSADGGSCSCEAWNPTIGISGPYPSGRRFSPGLRRWATFSRFDFFPDWQPI